MQSFQHFTQTHFWAVRDYLAPVLRESKFKEHGRITPGKDALSQPPLNTPNITTDSPSLSLLPTEEFVAAGDFLCYKFPTWSWEAGDPAKRRDFLPETKQYLISRNGASHDDHRHFQTLLTCYWPVACLRRASQMVYTDKDEDAETMMSFAAEGAVGADDEEWAVTHTTRPAQSAAHDIGDIPDIDQNVNSLSLSAADHAAGRHPDATSNNPEEAIPNLDDIPDMDDDLGDAGGIVEAEDDATAAPQVDLGQNSPSNLISVRTYDCLITYDKYYQTPRMWLMGYDEHKRPLTPSQTFADISSDYAQKTVTIEPFPHLNGLNLASVHPCKHSSVMKKMIERMDGSFKEAQQKNAASGPAGSISKKKGWIGGVVKKATGGSSSGGSGSSSKDKKAASNPATSPTSATNSLHPDGQEPEIEGLRVDQYLLVFLKFISSVVPTIEIDSTTSV
ncbi:autophagy-related protein 3 [Puccinia sorghi]|uniref:Autophagy-related protein 3 n=1 Tax=Puccinia sorghi TaxID=27349 RepID=A0A0L6VI91_9BASI|nr:autophagy-related protein 3 [Puccinia sorghi]